ncbi:Cysteine protease [Mycena sanguinolenta]|uniref:Cysteine protease n=1 Tax=Mycena sanguinolenta TaxID=230812 RepID=A0A8H6X5H5_9AGAR|nr:Cysteine protease [Mycena sanguinolenta]
MPVPSNAFPVTRTVGGGATAIIHQWYLAAKEEQSSIKKPCTPHEFKRVKVLRVGDRSALEFLVEQAGASSGYNFRVSDGASTLTGKGKRISINEIVATKTGHSIICTQHVMIRLMEGFQLQISRVYQIRNSTTQARDMAELVLFYTHSALGLGTKYPQSSRLATGLHMLTSIRVTIPVFPSALFQPYEGVFRKSGLNHRTHRVPQLLLPIALGTLRRRHSVTHWQRRCHDFTWPPSLVVPRGAYSSAAFSICIKAGFSTMTSNQETSQCAGCRIPSLYIDFDNASLDHTCTGVSCGELLQVAEVLNINLAAELSTLEGEPKTRSNFYIAIVRLRTLSTPVSSRGSSMHPWRRSAVWFGPSAAAIALRMLVDAFPTCGLGVSVATDGTLYRNEVLTASHSPSFGPIPPSAASSVSSSHEHGSSSSHRHGHGVGRSKDKETKGKEKRWGDRPVLLLLRTPLGLGGVNPIYYKTVKCFRRHLLPTHVTLGVHNNIEAGAHCVRAANAAAAIRNSLQIAIWAFSGSLSASFESSWTGDRDTGLTLHSQISLHPTAIVFQARRTSTFRLSQLGRSLSMIDISAP